MPRSSTFGRKRDLELIRLVKEHPEIYNSNHVDFSSYDKREVAWQMISDQMHIPTERCKSRYMNIRDIFRRSLLNRVRNPQNALGRYKYEHECGYLIPYYRDLADVTPELLQKITAKETTNNTEIASQSGQELEHVEMDDSFLDLDETFQSQDLGKTDKISSMLDLNPSDPLDVFLMTVGDTMKSFNPYYLNQAKSKIFQACQDYELKQMEDQQGSSGNG